MFLSKERGVVDAWLDRITRFATDLTYDHLPPEVVTAAKERLIDSLGCALAAIGLRDGCPPADVGRTVATAARRRDREGYVIASPERVSAESAAFVNSCLIRYLDFSDTYPGHHPSDALGALLAVAPVVGASGRDLLTAMAVSYELSIRLTRCGRFNRRGWDNGFATGIGAVAGLSSMLGLDPDRARHAIAIMATANMPLRAARSGQLSMWKGAATAYSVRDAVFAAHLAADGMTGPEAPFTGRHGVIENVTGPMDLEALGTEGGEYFLPRVKLKSWPLVHNMQPLVWAGLELRERLEGRQPERIEVFTVANAVRESGSEPEKWDPRTRETADHSAPYILAYVLRHGTIDHNAFDPEVVVDQTLRPEMARMLFSVDDEIEAEYPDTVRMHLVATDVTGRKYDIEVVNPMGHEKNPMDRVAIGAKFRRNSTGVLAPEEVDAVLERWWHVDDHTMAEAVDRLGRNGGTV